MRKVWEPVKAALLRGSGILIPILLLIFLINEALGLIIVLGAPIAELVLPKNLRESLPAPLVVPFLFIALALVVGFAATTQWARRAGRALERNTLERLPAYAALKGISQGFLGDESRARFDPVLVSYGDDTTVIGYLVEEIDDDRVVVLEPWAPTPFAGNVKIVPRKQVRRLDAGLGDVTGVLSRWGVGTRSLLSSGESGTVSTQRDELSG